METYLKLAFKFIWNWANKWNFDYKIEINVLFSFLSFSSLLRLFLNEPRTLSKKYLEYPFFRNISLNLSTSRKKVSYWNRLIWLYLVKAKWYPSFKLLDILRHSSSIHLYWCSFYKHMTQTQLQLSCFLCQKMIRNYQHFLLL